MNIIFLFLLLMLISCGSSENHDDWKVPKLPHEIFLNKELAKYEDDLIEVILLWNDAAEFELITYQGFLDQSFENFQAKDKKSSINALSLWPKQFKNDQFLAATLKKDDFDILERDIYLNFEILKKKENNINFNFKIVIAHEIGHLLGLDHTTAPQDIMFFQHNKNQDFILTGNDIKELKEKISQMQ